MSLLLIIIFFFFTVGELYYGLSINVFIEKKLEEIERWREKERKRLSKLKKKKRKTIFDEI